MKNLSLYVLLILMFCNVGYAGTVPKFPEEEKKSLEKICDTLNECLNKGYVQKDKILFKQENDLSIIYVLEKRKSIIHCIVRYVSLGNRTKFKGTYCVEP